MAEIITRYDVEDDAWVVVTQDWVDRVSRKIVELENALRIAKAEKDHGGESPRLETAEGEQSCQDSRESREGVQQGRRGQGQGAPKEVAVAYAVTVDGWIEIRPKVIRNENSPQIIWMLKSTWEHFATHADERGLFYIPCQPGMATDDELRCAVNQKEIADGS